MAVAGGTVHNPEAHAEKMEMPIPHPGYVAALIHMVPRHALLEFGRKKK
jgi:hypothetical protein